MTRDEILNMPAVRETDALIAEKVIGLKPKKATDPLYTDDRYWLFAGDWYIDSANGSVIELPLYTANMSAAWEVVEKARSCGWRYTLQTIIGDKIAMQFYNQVH